MSHKPFHDRPGIARGTAKCVSTRTCHKIKQPYTAELLGLETITRLPLNMFASIIKSFFLKNKTEQSFPTYLWKAPANTENALHK